jgi:hypothetical protein
MEHHVDKVCQSSFAYLRAISRLRRCMDRDTCTMAIKALVVSRMEYCCSNLYGINKKLVLKLQRIIHASVRLIECLKKSDDVSLHVREKKWLTAENRILLRMNMMVYTVLAYSTPTYISSIINVRQADRDLRSTSYVQLDIPHARTTMGSRAFSVSAPKSWNSIGVKKEYMKTRKGFRQFIIDHLLS